MNSAGRFSTLCLLLLLLLLTIVHPNRLCAEQRINRPASLSISLESQHTDPNLWDTSPQGPLDQLYAAETESFGLGLAEGLKNTLLRGDIDILPGYQIDDQQRWRQENRPDSFMLITDLHYSYGLDNSSPWAAMATFASCFLASPLKMFRYAAELKGHVVLYYVSKERGNILILDKEYTSRSLRKVNFFEAQKMSQESSWIRQLTRATLLDMRRQIISEFSLQREQAPWRRLAAELRQEAPERQRQPGTPPSPSKVGQDTGSGALQTDEMAALISRISPSVFRVLTEKSTGSGFVISARGYALTSLHVVEGAEDINLQFLQGRTLKARMILSAPNLDIAVLAIQPEGLTPLKFGESAAAVVGDTVVAAGFSRDLGLSVVPTSIVRVEEYQGVPLLRIDTELKEGNSGGPLLDSFGRVIAINIRRAAGQQEKVSFAIPIDATKHVFNHLLY